MAWMICFGTLAAFGAVSILWALFGWLLPGEQGGILLCRGTPGLPESFFIRRYVLLREMGLLNCPLVVVDGGLTETERKWLLQRSCGIEIVRPGELCSMLELERDRIDRTGNGDHSGRDQRRGVSEL